MSMRITPICKKCHNNLYWVELGRMGGTHTNMYKCRECGRVVEIADRDLRLPATKDF